MNNPQPAKETPVTTETTVSAQGPDSAVAVQSQPPPSAVQTRPTDSGAGVLIIRREADSPDNQLQRVEATITLPPSFQYAIPIKGVKLPNGDWDNSKNKVGITSDGYDYLNRVIGCSFFFPDEVHDEHGVMSPNPIHRTD